MAQQQQQQIAHGVSWIAQTGSTQDLVVGAEHVLHHGDVVATADQTAGRGRLNRTWDTPAGTAAAMSILLRPRGLPTELISTLTLVVADSLVRWFRDLGVDAGVKWPNDVQGPDGKKLCGILAQWLPETHAVVVGIGTNLEFGAGPRLATAGALADYGVTITAKDYVVQARQHILDAVTRYITHPDSSTLESTMITLGQRVKAMMPNGQDLVGTAIGLGPTGSLVIAGETTHEVFAADIVHLRPA